MNDFIDKRNKMLMNLESINYDEIVDFCNKFKIPIPSDMTSMLAGLHKARLYVVSIPDDCCLHRSIFAVNPVAVCTYRVLCKFILIN